MMVVLGILVDDVFGGKGGIGVKKLCVVTGRVDECEGICVYDSRGLERGAIGNGCRYSEIMIRGNINYNLQSLL
jgi:hypothetical protein